jgi:hypothetical protein
MGFYFQNIVPFHLYLGFQSRDFPETLHRALTTHALQKLCGCDRSVMKGTLPAEQITFRLNLGLDLRDLFKNDASYFPRVR